jgi:hypothetical protein
MFCEGKLLVENPCSIFVYNYFQDWISVCAQRMLMIVLPSATKKWNEFVDSLFERCLRKSKKLFNYFLKKTLRFSHATN